jgi:hypothetical protein
MAFSIISILLGYSPNIRKGFTFQKGETFKPQHKRQPRNVCRIFANPGIWRCSAPEYSFFKCYGAMHLLNSSLNLGSTNITGALHLASFSHLTLSQNKKVSPFKKVKALKPSISGSAAKCL